MATIGVPILLIVLALVLVLIGPGHLAGFGAALGQSIRGFRKPMRDPPAPEPAGDEKEHTHA